MKYYEISELCKTLGLEVSGKPDKKHVQYIRILVTADENDADYLRKEKKICFEDSDLPIILKGLRAFSKIGSFEELDILTEEDNQDLYNWSNLGENPEYSVPFEEWSFDEDEFLTDFIPFSESGCCCGGGRINGCHTLAEISVTIVDEDRKSTDVTF